MEIFLDEVDSSVVMLIFIFDTVVKMIIEPYSVEVGCWLSGPIFTPITTDRFPTHVTHQVGGLDHGFRAPCFVRSLASYFFIF